MGKFSKMGAGQRKLLLVGVVPIILFGTNFEDGRWLALAIIGRCSTNNTFWVQTLKMGAG